MTLHTFQENSWTDDLVLLEWIFTAWCSIAAMTPSVKLLILDSYPLHKEARLLSELDTHVLYAPIGLTWAVQLMDAGFFKATKDKLRKIWTSNQETITFPER